MPETKYVRSRREMEEILRKETLGFLGLSDAGQPYVVPLTYVYQNGRILFHCALEGRKLACIRANPRVCFTVGKQYDEVIRHPQGAHCCDTLESVICRGTARILTDEAPRREALNAFNRGIQPDADEITAEDARRCYAVEILVSHMTGRQRRKGEKQHFWEYSFQDE